MLRKNEKKKKKIEKKERTGWMVWLHYIFV